MSEPTKTGRPVYWKLSCYDKEGTKYSCRITGTKDEKEASNFYIRPVDPTDCSGSRFYITTDPEDMRHFKSKGTNNTDVDSKPLDDVERYLHVKDNQPQSSFEIVPCSLVNKKKAQFKLMDRIEGKKVKFLNSQWLPRTLCGSSIPGEPYFICPVSYSTWRHKHCITMVMPEKRDQQSQTDSNERSQTNDEYTTDIKRMSENPYHLMLFMLTAGHST